MFNVGDSAVINGGIYLAGYAEMNLGKATINSDSVSLGIKSGILNINGATINNNAESDLDNEPDSNGIDTSTAAIQVASNNGYAGNIEINITDGTFNSKNGPAFSEYIENGDSSKVTEINITGGTFNSANGQKVFSFSDSFAKNVGAFITGGTYNNTVDASLVKDGYIANKNGETYVVEEVKKEVNTEEIDTTREATEVTTGVKDASSITETLVESIEKNFAKETKNINATVEVEIENNKTVTDDVKTAIEEVLIKEDKNIKVLEYFDVTLVVKNSDTNEEIGKLEELTKEIELTIALPKDVQKAKDGYKRVFYVVRMHDGKAEIITPTLSSDGTYLTFKTDKFSSYAVAYNDVVTATNGEEVPKTYDGVGLYFGIGVVSVLGLAGIGLYINKNKKFN